MAFRREFEGQAEVVGVRDAGRSFRCMARAAERLLRVILRLRAGDLFRGKSKLASCARKQRNSAY
jgi:hypothetical protein